MYSLMHQYIDFQKQDSAEGVPVEPIVERSSDDKDEENALVTVSQHMNELATKELYSKELSSRWSLPTFEVKPQKD